MTSASRESRLECLSASTKSAPHARFLAVYTMKPEDLARFRSLPKSEQDAIDAIGLKQWADWEERNAASFPDRGGMVGKTTRDQGRHRRRRESLLRLCRR
ncbi:hypothetical protein MesoLjLb_51950 [Mesorhizobium sp. L-8-3]|nr:hypothetical protein MesoLjLb_51950 [Mesorhizobium sp. L-8-3]